MAETLAIKFRVNLADTSVFGPLSCGMIGIADPKLWNLGVGLLSKWNGLTFSFYLFIIYR